MYIYKSCHYKGRLAIFKKKRKGGSPNLVFKASSLWYLTWKYLKSLKTDQFSHRKAAFQFLPPLSSQAEAFHSFCPLVSCWESIKCESWVQLVGGWTHLLENTGAMHMRTCHSCVTHSGPHSASPVHILQFITNWEECWGEEAFSTGGKHPFKHNFCSPLLSFFFPYENSLHCCLQFLRCKLCSLLI